MKKDYFIISFIPGDALKTKMWTGHKFSYRCVLIRPMQVDPLNAL